MILKTKIVVFIDF